MSRVRWCTAVSALIWMMVLLPAIIRDDYLSRIATVAVIYGVAAVGQNVVYGLTGEFALCGAAWFGVGAYMSALLSVQGMPIFCSAVISIVLCLVIGGAIGMAALRTEGHFTALLTLSMGLIFYHLVLVTERVTGGMSGLDGIPVLPTVPWIASVLGGSEQRATYVVVLAVLLIATSGYEWLRNSAMGIQLRAHRDDALAAETVGIASTRCRLIGYCLAGGATGVAGVLFAHTQGLLVPANVSFEVSVSLMAMVVLGGADTRIGPVVGAFLLSLAPEVLRNTAEIRWLLYGIALVGAAELAPTGVMGWTRRSGTYGGAAGDGK